MKLLKKIWYADWSDTLAPFARWFEEKCPEGTIGRSIAITIALIIGITLLVILIITLLQVGENWNVKQH
jgi:hypothetical protein